MRGEVSQGSFATRFGITRSALANYELGRSLAPPDLLDRIKQHTGIDVSAGPEPADYEAEFRTLLGDGSTLTDDEWSVIRVLRIAHDEDARRVLSELVARIESRGEGLRLADQETIVLDLARLITVATGKRAYDRGTSAKTAMQVARALVGMLKP